MRLGFFGLELRIGEDIYRIDNGFGFKVEADGL